jgi:hypothetical protein
MSDRNTVLIRNYETNGTIGKYRIVKFHTADRVVAQAAADSDMLIGVNNDVDIASTDSRADIIRAGLAPVVYGGSVTRGDLLTSDANGKAVTAGDGDRAIGIAEISGVADDIGSVFLYPSRVDFGASVTASAAEINKLDGAPFDCTFTIGSESSNVINLGIQLLDANGADLAQRGKIELYFSDDANGDSIIATAPSGTVVIGTDGLLMSDDNGAKKRFTLVSEADGDIDINITEAGAKTMYAIAVFGNGLLKASGAITFAS